MNARMSLSLSFVLLLFVACSGKNPQIPQVGSPNPSASPLCYIHMQKGEKYLKCTQEPTPKEKNVELLRFYGEESIYPNYNFEMYKGEYDYTEHCDNVLVVGAVIKGLSEKTQKEKEEEQKCDSYYFKQVGLIQNATSNILTTAVMAVGTGGLSLALAPETLSASTKEFDHEFYNKVLKENAQNFAQISSQYSQYKSQIAEAKEKQISLRDKQFAKENKQINYIDKSGLLGNKKPCEISFFLGQDYDIISPKIPPFSTELNLSSLKPTLEQSVKKYEEIVKDAKKFAKLKENISVKCYEHVKEYEDSQKNITRAKDGVNLKVKVIIKSMREQILLPKSFALKDKLLSVNVEFTADIIKITYTNLTNKYMQVEDLSSYIILSSGENKIRTHFVNIQLPPESYITKSYTPSEILALIQYGGGNKKSLLAKHMNYGWAVKYRLFDTNKELSIYKNNKYNLFSLYKSLYM